MDNTVLISILILPHKVQYIDVTFSLMLNHGEGDITLYTNRISCVGSEDQSKILSRVKSIVSPKACLMSLK